MNISSNYTRQHIDRTPSARPQSGLRIPERVAMLRERLEARADVREAAIVRADVRAGREHVRDWSPEKAVSANTANRYAHAVQKMQSTGQKPENAACKASYEFRRAALVHETRKDIKSALTAIDRAKRNGDLEQAAGAYGRLRMGLNTLKQYPPSTGSREQDLKRKSTFHGSSRADPATSNGKRDSIQNLPSGWKDMVQIEVRPADRPAVAAMALTGCRPVECRGIKIRQSEDSLTFEIRGAKTDESRGIKTRSVTLSKQELDESQAGRDIQDFLGNREVRAVTVSGSVESFRERVSRAGDRAGLEQVSSYTYRHDEARELKNSGLEKSEIAQRLGHRSDRSQSVYG